jgi:hypothetical protein
MGVPGEEFFVRERGGGRVSFFYRSGRDDNATMTRVGRREGGGDAGDDHDKDDANDAAANDDAAVVVVVVVVVGNNERDAPALSCDITASPIPPKIAIDPPPPSTPPVIDYINNARRDKNILDDMYRMRNGSGVSNIEPIALTRSSMSIMSNTSDLTDNDFHNDAGLRRCNTIARAFLSCAEGSRRG